jgi:hypothetical protein
MPSSTAPEGGSPQVGQVAQIDDLDPWTGSMERILVQEDLGVHWKESRMVAVCLQESDAETACRDHHAQIPAAAGPLALPRAGIPRTVGAISGRNF